MTKNIEESLEQELQFCRHLNKFCKKRGQTHRVIADYSKIKEKYDFYKEHYNSETSFKIAIADCGYWE